MKRTLRYGLVILSLVVAGSALADGFRLKRVLVEGETTKYKVELGGKQNISSPMFGDQEIGSNTVTILQIKTLAANAAAKSFDIEATTTVESSTKSGAMAAMVPSPKAGEQIVQKATLNVQNKLILAKNTKVSNQIQGLEVVSAAGLMIDFPDRDLKVGDSWEVSIPASPYTVESKDAKYTATVQSEKTLDGKDVVIISLVGSAKTTIDVGKMMAESADVNSPIPAGTKVITTSDAELHSDIVVEKATGRTISVTATVKSKETTDVDMNGQPLSIPSTTTLTLSVKLQP